jgi:hypothetical protein
LPQETSFTTYGRVDINISSDEKYFTASAFEIPIKVLNFIAQSSENSLQDIIVQGENGDGASNIGFVGSGGGGKGKLFAEADMTPAQTMARNTPNTATNVSKTDEGYTAQTLAQKIKTGFAVEVIDSFGEFSKKVIFRKHPIKLAPLGNGSFKEEPIAVPYLFVIEEYVTKSFIGDFGAGKVLSNHSLFPGEKTTITMKTFKEIKSVKSSAQNIIDSFSQESAKEMENLLENETVSQNSDTNEVGIKVRASAGFKIKGLINAKASTNTSYTGKFVRSQNVRNVNKALNKSVDKSNASRQVEINTSTQDSSTQSEEISTVREFMNINKSRVLNFAFRELVQEYISITYLNDIKIGFSNGHPEMDMVVGLEELNKLLDTHIQPDKHQEIRGRILFDYAKMVMYGDEPSTDVPNKVIDFILPVKYVNFDKVEEFHLRKNRQAGSTYTAPNGKAYRVNGVILSVEKYTLRTPAVLVDAFLGYGESLDCFNNKLQQEEVKQRQIDTHKSLQSVEQETLHQQKTQLAMEIINEIKDPIQKAEWFDKLFNPKQNIIQQI